MIPVQRDIFGNYLPPKKAADFPRLLATPNTNWLPPETMPSLSGAKTICVDIETYDPDLLKKGPAVRRGGYICGVSIATDDGFSAYFPVRHPNSHNFDEKQLFRWLNNELGRPEQDKLGANLIYDLDYLKHAGVNIKGNLFDVQLAEPIIDENAKYYNLNALAKKYLNAQKESDAMYKWCAESFGGKPDRSQAGNIHRVPAALVGPYAESDTSLPLQIFKKQREILEKNGWWDAFMLETRLLPLMVEMRQRGIRIDVERMEQMDAELVARRDAGLAKLKAVAGFDVNVNAAADISRLFKKLGITAGQTESGRESFAKDTLIKSDIGKLIMEIRAHEKFSGTSISGLRDLQIDGRVHTQFNQLKNDEYGTVSYRFSSATPNLQNIPKRDDEWGPKLRGLFIPENDCQLLSCDYSQIEYRLLVHYGIGEGADDARKIYRDDRNADFHEMASKITGVPRKIAKGLNFGIVYGMGIGALAESLGIARDDAESKMNEYHRLLPFVKNTSFEVSRRAKNKGFITLLDGRQRRFPDPQMCYKALNALLQGGAAVIMKKAMVDLYESGIFDKTGFPHLTVHDELVVSIPHGMENSVAEIESIMENVWPLKIPLLVNSKLGKNWGMEE